MVGVTVEGIYISRHIYDLRQKGGEKSKILSDMIYDIFINCNWVVTRWQYTFTHKQYIEQQK